MVSRIDSDDVEAVIEYLIKMYSEGKSFHKSAYIRDALGISSNKIAKILERIRDNKIAGLHIFKYGRRTWVLKSIETKKEAPK